jgi:uncharacterized ferritin-like protein (DUF455 family)
MGLGFEGGNLDHTRRFQADFASAGDDRALAIVAQVHDEEISHVRFGLHWFRKFTGVAEVPTGPAPTGEVQGSTPFDDFAHWRNTLPHPLSPVLMKGVPLDLEARRKAGMGEEFLTRLDKWTLDDR